jgi:thiamine biosynthesis lipoprotein
MLSPRFETKLSIKVLRFEAIGTSWQIDFATSQATFLKLKKQIMERIDEFDKNYSRFRTDSLVTEMSRHGGLYDMPDDAAPLFRFYADMYELTDGAVTPLIGQTLSEAGYDATYSFTPHQMHRPPTWKEVLELNGSQLHLNRAALLDFGAAGKGYLVDIISGLIAASGVTEYCVDAGGDMYHHSGAGTALKVGLEHPEDSEQVVGTVELYNRAICCSAGNKRAWGNYHHILDPETQQSPLHIKSIWTIADSTMLADGMATCLFFVGPDKLLSAFNFEYLIVYADYTYDISKPFSGQLFTGFSPRS